MDKPISESSLTSKSEIDYEYNLGSVQVQKKLLLKKRSTGFSDMSMDLHHEFENRISDEINHPVPNVQVSKNLDRKSKGEKFKFGSSKNVLSFSK